MAAPGSLHLNRNARAILEDKVIPHADKLGVKVQQLTSGTTVIDMGIDCPGGFMAARYFVEAGLGGLGQVTFGKMKLNQHWVPTVRVTMTMPQIAQMSSFVASFRVPWQGRAVTLSGPGRSIRPDPAKDFFAHAIPYQEPNADTAVFMIQTTQLPDDALVEQLVLATGIRAKDILLVAAPTSCIVGAIQVCARNVEQTLPTLVDAGFEISAVEEAFGVTPVVSVVGDEQLAYGRVNDCLIYGQESVLYVNCEDREIEEKLDAVPFSNNTDIYGTPFYHLFARCDNDWAKVPRRWDAPCKVVMINGKTGNRFSVGRIGYDVLEQSFIGEGRKI